MGEDKKKEIFDNVLEQFKLLPEPEKTFIAGYITRVTEEYARKECQTIKN